MQLNMKGFLVLAVIGSKTRNENKGLTLLVWEQWKLSFFKLAKGVKADLSDI